MKKPLVKTNRGHVFSKVREKATLKPHVTALKGNLISLWSNS